MSVFNCAPFENEDSVDTVGFEVTTQTDDIETGELAVEGSLKIKGVQGINVAVSGDTVVIGIDPKMFPEDDAGGGGTDSGDSCTCPNIVTFNSVEEMNAANLPDGTIVLVPSKSGESSGNDSGFSLPVVELTTVIAMCSSSTPSKTTTLNDADQAAIDAAADTGLPVMIKAKNDDGLVFSVIGNNTGGACFECGYCLTSAKAVIAYDGETSKWEFRLTYVGE
jgi:hypothetical protein